MPAVVLPQFLLCGLLVPRDQMQPVLEAVSDLLPLSYAVDAMVRLSEEGGVDGALLRDIGVIAGCVVAAVALGALTLRRRTR